jgi:hypothetical protein
VPVARVEACRDSDGAVRGIDNRVGPLARDLPETALHATSRRPTTQPSAAPFTCAIVWEREVLQGAVNHRRIDGKDRVAGSIPAGGSTEKAQLSPGATPGLSRDQEPATTFAREFARLSCTF